MNTSEDTYDLAVIGGGTAGLVSAFVASSLGARVVLIERDKIGGECLWTGCVPSKTLIKSARVYETVKRAAEFGIHLEAARIMWPAIQMRILAVRDEIRENERREIAKSNLETVKGTARFTDSNTLHVATSPGANPNADANGERVIHARKFILATGSRTRVPDLEGLRQTGFKTHENIYEMPRLPRSLLILGGGPIACEFAQAFRRLDCDVTIIQKGERLLAREDHEISLECERLMRQMGIAIYLQAEALRARSDEAKHIDFQLPDGSLQTASGNEILIAIGKEPGQNPRGAELKNDLNLAAADVRMGPDGIVVDEYLRTSAPNIWACGDCTGGFLFTHVAEYEAKIAAQNALLPLKAKANYRVVPWTTFTDPEIAHLGLSEEEAKEQGEYKVYRAHFKDLDRAIIEGETQGFCKVITGLSGRIAGAHIIGPQAGELIHAFVSAVRDGALIQEMAETIHVYPTLSEIAHRAGNTRYQELLDSSLVKRGLRWVTKLS